MIKLYLKQAWALLRQNPLFSTLYIAGTGLAIAMTMIVAMIYYVKLAPVYPEVNRGRTLYLTYTSFKSDRSEWQSALSHSALQDWALQLENAEAVSAQLSSWQFTENAYIQPEDRSGDFHPQVKLTDPAFFRIYAFRFLEGNPFTESDLQSGIRTAVITDDLARRLFGTTEGVVGRSFSLSYVHYRVCGVVRGGSYLTPQSYAQVYLPYSVAGNYRKTPAAMFPYLGSFKLTFLVKDDAQAKALKTEVEDVTRRLNLEHEGQWKMNLWEQPTTHALSVFQAFPAQEFNFWAKVRYFGLMLLVLLLVPALNLSGMIASEPPGGDGRAQVLRRGAGQAAGAGDVGEPPADAPRRRAGAGRGLAGPLCRARMAVLPAGRLCGGHPRGGQCLRQRRDALRPGGVRVRLRAVRGAQHAVRPASGVDVAQKAYCLLIV